MINEAITNSIEEAANVAANNLTIGTAIIYALIAAVLGLIISCTYQKTGKVSTGFARTLVILPVLVCVVMICVNGNLGASVAVMGAFSLIRFRSLQGTARDIAYIFLAMSVGIAISVGQPVYAVVITVFVCAVLLLLGVTKFAAKPNNERELRITIPEDLDYNDIFDDIFAKYTKENKLVRVKTTNMGSMYEITYRVEINDEKQIKEMIDEIRVRNGNLNVVLGRCDLRPEEEL